MVEQRRVSEPCATRVCGTVSRYQYVSIWLHTAHGRPDILGWADWTRPPIRATVWPAVSLASDHPGLLCRLGVRSAGALLCCGEASRPGKPRLMVPLCTALPLLHTVSGVRILWPAFRTCCGIDAESAAGGGPQERTPPLGQYRLRSRVIVLIPGLPRQ